MKAVGETQALQLLAEGDFDKKRLPAVVELHHEFVAELAEATDERKPLQALVQRPAEGQQTIVVVVHGLQSNGESVVSQCNGPGKFGLHVFVQSDLVAHVGEIRLFSADALGHHQRFSQGEVRHVFVFLQGIQHKYFGALEFRDGLVGDMVCIGDVAEVADAEAEYRQAQVRDGQGEDVDARCGERCVVDLDEVQLRDAGIAHGFEGIAELHPKLGKRVLLAVHGHIVALHEVVGAHVVESCGVVFVTVGEEDGVEPWHAFAQHLLAEVGTGVDDEAYTVDVNVHGCSESLVAVVQGTADFAGAPDNGYAL